MNEWMTDDEVAALCGLSVKTVQKWRYRGGKGPAYVKLGGAVRYRRADVEAWVLANTHPGGGAA